MRIAAGTFDFPAYFTLTPAAYPPSPSTAAGLRSLKIDRTRSCVARHPRHTRRRILLDPAHYEGPSTERVAAPVPLGRMGRRLQELWALPPERRSIAQYAALAEVAR